MQVMTGLIIRMEVAMKKFFVFALFAFVLAACGASKPTDPLMEIQARVGSEFKMVIESNPTTGYHWEIVGELDESVVEFVSRDYKPDAPQTVGSGGVDEWVFKAVGAGDTTITLGYYPPSNDPTEPAQTETFTVIVR